MQEPWQGQITNIGGLYRIDNEKKRHGKPKYRK